MSREEKIYLGVIAALILLMAFGWRIFVPSIAGGGEDVEPFVPNIQVPTIPVIIPPSTGGGDDRNPVTQRQLPTCGCARNSGIGLDYERSNIKQWLEQPQRYEPVSSLPQGGAGKSYRVEIGSNGFTKIYEANPTGQFTRGMPHLQTGRMVWAGNISQNQFDSLPISGIYDYARRIHMTSGARMPVYLSSLMLRAGLGTSFEWISVQNRVVYGMTPRLQLLNRMDESMRGTSNSYMI